ncbi:MAG TPA: squalene/phytoene synthase family protein, partial [Bacteroidota bacterium]|nr:squalene/phytoene synthase family protein [Bacteroidota bacterium]
DLLGYCSNSANPVGRLVLMVFGYRDEALFSLSDNICTALQLANFWQDVGVDLGKDRLYLPLDDMKEFGYSVDDWKAGIYDERFKHLMKFEIDRTRDLFYQGASLPSLVNKDLEVELKLIWFGGMEILRQTEKSQFDVFRNRPILSGSSKLRIFLRAMWYGDLTKYGKKSKPWELA